MSKMPPPSSEPLTPTGSIASTELSETDESLQGMYASIDGKTTRLTYLSGKSGGANSAGEHGGIYSYENGKKALVKTEASQEKPENIAKDMAEFLAGKIFEVTAPYHSARVAITRMHDAEGQPTGKPYICSVFFDNYKDLSEKVTDDKFLKKNGRTFAAGFVNKITGFMRAQMLGADGKPRYTGFPETMATSLLLGDFDVHTGNVGLVDSTKLVRIDYAASFDKLEPEIHPNSRSRHPFGAGPTNHFREYPRSMRISPEFADHAFEVANKNLEPKINEAMDALAKHYDYDHLVEFGKRLGGIELKQEIENINTNKNVSMSNLSHRKQALSEKIKDHLTNILKQRQESLKQYAIEISIDLCFDAEGKFRNINKADGTIINGREHFAKLVIDHPDYFNDIASNKKKLHFRDNDHKTKFSFFNWTGLTREAKLKKAVMDKILEHKLRPGEVLNPLYKGEVHQIGSSSKIMQNKKVAKDQIGSFTKAALNGKSFGINGHNR